MRHASRTGRRTTTAQGAWCLSICLCYGLVAATWAPSTAANAQPAPASPDQARLVHVGEGWARSSVNAVIFRQHSVVTHESVQYAAYYDSTAHVVLARRLLGSDEWTRHRTEYTGNVRDAHNAISLGVDGRGVLHVSWDQHGGRLRYARGVRPGVLALTDPLPMTGEREEQVTYPQFYHLPDGDLLFVYRDGSSGRGDVMLDRYDVEAQSWEVVQHPLIDGEGERNAYVNGMVIDDEGGWHVSWTWRETWDVATNHDVLYAYSPDEGTTWRTSGGEIYVLPITAESAEVARRVPQGRELINQTAMAVDGRGRPHIATYWRPEGSAIPQYQLVWHDGEAWRTSHVGRRTRPFSLSGGGTKRIPISRPQVLLGDEGTVYVVFRDEERGNGVTVAVSDDSERAEWELRTIYQPSVGAWEPTYDPVVWQRHGQLHLFVQRVGQGDAETLEDVPPQPVSILEWTP